MVVFVYLIKSLIINDTEQFSKRQAFLDTCQLYDHRFKDKYCTLPLIKEKMQLNYIHYFNHIVVLTQFILTGIKYFLTFHQNHLKIMKIHFHLLNVILFLMEDGS